MGELRLKCGVLKDKSNPIFSIDIVSSDLNDENLLIRNILLVLTLALKLYDAKIVVQDNFLEASIDEQYPLGVCCFLYFNSLNDGYNYIKFLEDTLK